MSSSSFAASAGGEVAATYVAAQICPSYVGHSDYSGSGLFRVWIISRYVFLSVRGMTNWKVNEARSSYVIVYCTTEGPDYSSTFGSTEVGGREVSMTVIIIY